MTKYNKSQTFIREKTGSATMINLDGKWEHNFVNDDTPAGFPDKNTGRKKPVTKD